MPSDRRPPGGKPSSGRPGRKPPPKRGGRPGQSRRPNDRDQKRRTGPGPGSDETASAPPRVPNVRRDQPRESGPKPDIAWEGPIAQLPKGVRKEIAKLVRNERAVDDVVEAIAIGSAAIDVDDTEQVLPLLSWAKDRCPRSPTVRETFGVALYLAGQWEQATSELAAYKRMSGRNDHNHVLADARRAAGAPLDVFRPLLVQATEDERLPDDVRVESWLVWAGALADDADVNGALAVLRQATKQLDRNRMHEEPRARLDYLTAELLERAGESDRAHKIFRRLADELPGWLDVDERAARP